MAIYIKPEAIKDASLPIGKVAAMSENERLAFLVSLGLGKIGVVSQVQNWASDNSGYTISDVVRGFIPQEFITMAKAAGANYNDATGYFEANSLTDLTYEDMQKIMIESGGKPFTTTPYGLFKSSPSNGRTILFPTINPTAIGTIKTTNLAVIVDSNTIIEDFTLNTYVGIIKDISYAFFNATRLRTIKFNMDKTTGAISAFTGCNAFQNAFLSKLPLSVSFENSPLLTTESILYMINNASTTATITITLHKTAYARAMADESILAALEAHPNISLAQA